MSKSNTAVLTVSALRNTGETPVGRFRARRHPVRNSVSEIRPYRALQSLRNNWPRKKSGFDAKVRWISNLPGTAPRH